MKAETLFKLFTQQQQKLKIVLDVTDDDGGYYVLYADRVEYDGEGEFVKIETGTGRTVFVNVNHIAFVELT